MSWECPEDLLRHELLTPSCGDHQCRGRRPRKAAPPLGGRRARLPPPESDCNGCSLRGALWLEAVLSLTDFFPGPPSAVPLAAGGAAAVVGAGGGPGAAMRFRAKIVDLACLNHFSREFARAGETGPEDGCASASGQDRLSRGRGRGGACASAAPSPWRAP